MSFPVTPFCHALQARKDWFFIAMPNAMGVAFNIISLILCVILPARDRQNSDSKEPNALKKMLQSLRGEKAEPAPLEVSESHEIDLAVEAVSHSHTK